MMEVEVEELCTNTVTSMPTTNPATGFERIAFFWNISPATLPVRIETRQTGGRVLTLKTDVTMMKLLTPS